MGAKDQVKAFFQDIIAPELKALQGKMDGLKAELLSEIRRLDAKIENLDARVTIKIESLRTEMLSMKGELLSEIRRLDIRIDSLDRELKTAIALWPNFKLQIADFKSPPRPFSICNLRSAIFN